MSQSSNSVPNDPIVSDATMRDTLRRHIHRAVNMPPRAFTRPTLAQESGVNIHTIDAILSTDAAKHRRVALADGLAIASVLGERAVNALLADIGYGGAKPLDEVGEPHPIEDVAKAMGAFNVFVQAAADDRIDHVEGPAVRDAADTLVATFLPYSQHGGAA